MAKAGARASSMSRSAFSVAAFSMSVQPRSMLSAEHSCTTCSTSDESTPACCNSTRKWLPHATRSGSLHVTLAREPARFCTMSCAALRIRISSGSMAKSLSISSRVVTHEMVTERSTTGEMISRIARSSARGTTRLRCGCCVNSASEALTCTYEARLGITVGSCMPSTPPARSEGSCGWRLELGGGGGVAPMPLPQWVCCCCCCICACCAACCACCAWWCCCICCAASIAAVLSAAEYPTLAPGWPGGGGGGGGPCAPLNVWRSPIGSAPCIAFKPSGTPKPAQADAGTPAKLAPKPPAMLVPSTADAPARLAKSHVWVRSCCLWTSLVVGFRSASSTLSVLASTSISNLRLSLRSGTW
mmetsp:Transcript_25717/g.56357  ORF Transcript_25717/g.56357 Transcript_25717/m.56357 type:complete len:359 (-) Transcript_25717:1945-3021(-)